MRLIVIAVLTCAPFAMAAKDPQVADRGLVLAVASDAAPEVKAASNSIKAAIDQQPLLKAMAGGHEIKVVDSDKLLSGPVGVRAFNHVIVVGLPNDPLIATVWQREAAVEEGGLFLHGAAIDRAPYETELVTISGTNPQGVALAAKAFLQRDIVNGVIASSGEWSRPSTSLLDRDPVAADVSLPAVPAMMGDAPMIGVTQASGDEYRNVLADAQVVPAAIWRFKYLPPAAWDAGGSESAIAVYKAGLHRRAFADTVWAGVFADPAAAEDAAGKIADAANLKKNGQTWTGSGNPKEGAPVAVWVKDKTVYMTDLRRK
jgi:hypothetical protein